MNELYELLEKTERFLKNRQALYGDVLLPERSAVGNVQSEESIKKQRQPALSEEQKPLAPAEISVQAMPRSAEEIPTVEPAEKEWQTAEDLPVLYEKIHECRRCPLGETRTKFVFGVGNPNADVMVIGEAPGADEDAKGEPFVGAAGQLLTKILGAIGFRREDVFIANILKCRPPNNRRPLPEEVAECEPYLFKQIELVQPKFILALGLTAVNTLLKADHKMGDIRGKKIPYRGAIMIPTYHPAALLRNPNWKAATWEDVQFLRKLYDESIGQS